MKKSPSRRRPSRAVWSQAGILAGILLAGLVLRLAVAPAEGNDFDIGVNQGWARSAVELGLARSYSEQVNGNMLPNYPPFSLMLFAGTGLAYHSLYSETFDFPLAYRIAIKLPAILADLATALLFFFVIRKWKNRKAGYLATALYTFHPAVIYDSAVWGQTDSIFTFFMTAGLASYGFKQYLSAGALSGLSVLTKMQAIMVGPLFAYLFIRSGWKGLLKGVGAALIVLALVLLPYALGGNLEGVKRVYLESVGYYAIVSSAAYNFWWSLLGDTAGTVQDTTLLFNVISYRYAGFLLVGALYVLQMFFLRRRLKITEPYHRLMPALFLSAALASLIFFLFNTQMHERYLFPFVAFGLPLVFWNRKAAVLYAMTSLFFFINLLGWLPLGSVDRAIYSAFPSFDILIASLQLVAFVGWMQVAWNMGKDPAARKPAGWARIGQWKTSLLKVLRRPLKPSRPARA